jgi:hypothetical protein
VGERKRKGEGTERQTKKDKKECVVKSEKIEIGPY